MTHAPRMKDRSIFTDTNLRMCVRHALAGHKVPAQDIDDLLQTTLIAAYEASALPEQEPNRTKFVCAIARNKVREHWRTLARNTPMATEQLDEVAGAEQSVAYDTVEFAKKVAAAAAATDAEGARWLHWNKVEGKPASAIAAAEGVTEEKVQKRVSRLRHAMIAFAATLAALVAWRVHRMPNSANVATNPTRIRAERPHALPAAPTDPANDPTSPAPVQATRLRQRATEQCNHQRWGECQTSLDAAKALDPDGDNTPGVQSLRRLLELRMHHYATPAINPAVVPNAGSVLQPQSTTPP